MKKNILLIVAMVAFTGCKFLEHEPDNRTDINSLDKVKKLLTTGYSDADFAFLGEFSSDNIIDNYSEDGTWTRFNLSLVKGEVENEVFTWNEAKSAGTDGDSPVGVWSSAYMAIAVANHALEAIRKLDPDSTAAYNSARAEAYLIRAYHHFVLANVFCQAYMDKAHNDANLGVPYITIPEKVVHTNADRGTLTQLYDRIEQDMLLGLKGVTDDYDQPKYHFNKQAAYAFAARFYLYKRDWDNVIKYATMALGNNPMSFMRTGFWSKAYSTSESLKNAYSSTTNPSNFLLCTTYSTFYRSLGGRYACNRQASKATIYGSGPTWQSYTYHPCYMKIQGLYLYGDQEHGLFFPHTGEYFEYTDKVAGIGYVHNVNTVFTAEETLLCRAEAYIWKEDYQNALADLRVWDDSRKVGLTTEVLPTLEESMILSFYSPNQIDRTINGTLLGQCNTLHCSEIDPAWVVKDNKQYSWISCVLHFRRLETIHEGLRWFDIKRYGIEITHHWGSNVYTLSCNDSRRAIQIPSTVIEAGMQPNPRVISTPDNSATRFTGSCTIEQ